MTDVDRKLGRAEHHRDELARLLEEFRRRKPFRIDERTDEWDGRPYLVHFACELEPVPDDAALIFGDVVQNLRASLDYLIGELRPGGPTLTSGFPICATDDCFKSARGRDLEGVPPEAVSIIERMEAYGPSPDREHMDRWPDGLAQRELYRPLRWLHTLWNIDKHRALAVAAGWLAPDWATGSDVGYVVDPAAGRAEWWVPMDGRDPHPPMRFEVKVNLTRPPRGFADDWPVDVAEFELDALAASLCHSVRGNVLRELGSSRLA